MRLRNKIIWLAGLAGLAACNSDSTWIRGHFIGATRQPVYLERVVPGATVPQFDTVVANDRGEFKFRVTLSDHQPTLFNLLYDGDNVPLLVSPHEKVNVMSMGDLDGYRVGGSPESELVWKLHRILSDGAASLDSLSNKYNISSENRDRFLREWVDKYQSIKRQHIAFIVENSSSLAAVYALYQRLPGDDILFNGDNDYIYYQMVADSVRVRYPASRYLQALDRDIASMAARRDLQNRISGGIAEIDYPEIELPDMYSQKVKLSSLAGKVIVLDFWSATDSRAPINNADMKELWTEYSDSGLAIYQVSLDTDRALWVNAVQEQKLPWITVCDFRGQTTQAVMVYNITSIPANFVFDRQGNIVGKNLFGDALAKKLKELF